MSTNTTTQNNYFLDFIQGTGFMECTPLFYGFYPNHTLEYTLSSTSSLYYNLPLAYVLVTLAYFVTSLCTTVKSAAAGFKERLVENEGHLCQYSNLIFAGWDFCIVRSAAIEHLAIFHEIRARLDRERRREMSRNRTKGDNFKLYVIRVIVNLTVLTVLAFCGGAIYYALEYTRQQESSWQDCSKDFRRLVDEFLPSFVIVLLNVTVPFAFRYLTSFERYSPEFVVKIILFRTILLRLASIFTLCVSVYTERNSDDVVKCGQITCWETYVGQQIYKLALTDFASHLVLTFVINFPRSLLANFNSKFFKWIGEQSFDLPKHVLDVVYLQTLCWLGCFFAPLLSFVFVLIIFFMFHVKKFVCLVNSRPSSLTVHRAARSKSMFMVVVLVSFVSALVPSVFVLGELEPSRDCGPFRGGSTVWSVVEGVFLAAPAWVQNGVAFLTTAAFAVPVFIVLVLFLYYFRAVNAANRHMVGVLKNQLVMEGHDKQFLLERLSKFIQEHQKRIRRGGGGSGDGDKNPEGRR